MTEPSSRDQSETTTARRPEGGANSADAPLARLFQSRRFALSAFVIFCLLAVAAWVYVPGHWQELANTEAVRMRRGINLEGDAFPIALLAVPILGAVANGVRYLQLRRQRTDAR